MSITPAPGFPEQEPDQKAEPSGPTQPTNYPTQPTNYPTQAVPPPPGYVPPAPYPYPQAAPAAPSRNWFPPVASAALVLLAITNIFLYSELSDTRKLMDQQLASLKERDSKLERRLEASDRQRGELSGDLRQTRERLGLTQRDLSRTREATETLTEEQRRAQAQLGQVGQQVSSLRDESGQTGQKLGALTGEVSGAKQDIVATRKDLEATRLQLTSAIGDISKASVLIARNHDELVELKRRGERNYFEFDLGKEKAPRRIGDISLLLKKADTRRQRYTVEVLVEDSRVEKKDKTVNEPVQFYTGRSRSLYEIVVNRVGKDRITGYLSTPK